MYNIFNLLFAFDGMISASYNISECVMEIDGKTVGPEKQWCATRTAKVRYKSERWCGRRSMRVE